MQTRSSSNALPGSPSVMTEAAPPRVGRLKEMPPFGEPETAYPPSWRTDGRTDRREADDRPGDDDPLGLFLPPDRAAD